MDIELIRAGKGREVRTIMPDATVAEAVDRVRAKNGSEPLSSPRTGARIAGIISYRGIMNAIADHGVDVVNERVHSVMTKEVFTCVPQDRVSAIMAAMTSRRIRHIPVVEKKRTSVLSATGSSAVSLTMAPRKAANSIATIANQVLGSASSSKLPLALCQTWHSKKNGQW